MYEVDEIRHKSFGSAFSKAEGIKVWFRFFKSGGHKSFGSFLAARQEMNNVTNKKFSKF